MGVYMSKLLDLIYKVLSIVSLALPIVSTSLVFVDNYVGYITLLDLKKIFMVACFLNVGGLLLMRKKIKQHKYGYDFLLVLVILFSVSTGLFLYYSITVTSPAPPPGPTPISILFYPSGWIGDNNDISFNNGYRENQYSPTCIQIRYSPAGPEGWTGVYWLYPDKNWGDDPNGWDLSSKKKVTFLARGAIGGEIAEFKVGGITGKKYEDSLKNPTSTGEIVLSKEWQSYTIDLSGQNLRHVIGGFCWVTSKNLNPSGCTIYLDDIVYE